MKVHHCEQRTAEWHELRKGRITASVANKLMTPTGKASTQASGEIGRIIAEANGWQEPEFLPPLYWVERGIDLEPEARGWFQVETGLVVRQCGFISDGDMVGFSPDGFVEIPPTGTMKDLPHAADLIIPAELKCPKPSTHIRWVLDGVVPKDHINQLHFGMAVTKAPYAYFMSYHPECRSLLIKVERDERTRLMEELISQFTDDLAAAMEEL